MKKIGFLVMIISFILLYGCKEDSQSLARNEFANQVFAKNNEFNIRVQDLEKENKIVYNVLAEYRTNNEILKKENEALRISISNYKKEIDLLNKKYALAITEAYRLQIFDNWFNMVNVKVDTADTVEKSITDLQDRIIKLRSKVALGRNKITGLIRATVDQQYVGIVNKYSSTKGGDFRTLHEKENAIRKAKEENLPFEQELTSLEKQLSDSKIKLAKLRSNK